LTPETLRKTDSLCPVCLRRIPARVVSEDGKVFLEKTCPHHGFFRVIVWRDTAESYLQWADYGGAWKGIVKDQVITAVEASCPFDCGICPLHEQGTATAAIMTTNRCNLSCPICFTHEGDTPLYEPDQADIEKMLRAVYDRCGNIPIEFCGGEPTVRADLPDLVHLATNIGFNHIQVNTNGIQIARETGYLSRLKSAGATTIYLQFDGVGDQVYRQTRGKDLYTEKCRALQVCLEVKIGVILVPTIVPGVNFHQIGQIINFAKEWVPTVKGVYFQPISYFGKYPSTPGDQDRVTIPDMLEAIEDQTQGEILRENFIPPACEHPFCSFSGFAIVCENGKLAPTTHLRPRRMDEAGVEHARQFTKKTWRYQDMMSETTQQASPNQMSTYEVLSQQIRQKSLFISGMLFQDVWNLDLERLKRCCIHIVTQDKHMIPLCAKYLTSSSGKRLYPGMA
jgi:7,8-dihydro-6-hydroxymethylpterin dimethyltransferase